MKELCGPWCLGSKPKVSMRACDRLTRVVFYTTCPQPKHPCSDSTMAAPSHTLPPCSRYTANSLTPSDLASLPAQMLSSLCASVAPAVVHLELGSSASCCALSNYSACLLPPSLQLPHLRRSAQSSPLAACVILRHFQSLSTQLPVQLL